ncbi:MAG: adenylate kinase [Clostridia bacterium]
MKGRKNMYIIMLGAPGSGKGTAAKILAKKTNLLHISTGDMFREQIKKETELGKLANSYMSQGQLVPDEVTINIVKDRLNWEDAETGVILDGFPRTLEQAKALDQMLQEKGKKVTVVPELVISDEIIIDRILNRQTCSNKECGAIYNSKYKPSKVEGVCDVCGAPLVSRKDDNEETIKNRLEVYRENSKDLISYYKEKGVLVTITPEDPTADNASEQAVEIILKAIQ